MYGLLTTGILVGFLNSINFSLEKHIFTLININDFILIRTFIALILFSIIYLINPQIFDKTKNIKWTELFKSSNIKVLIYITISCIISIIFWILKNYGLDNYKLGLFTTMFLVISVLISTIIGYLIFNEKINNIQYIGIIIAIIALILLNIK